MAKAEAAQASYPFPFASALSWNPSVPSVYSPYLPTPLGNASGPYLSTGTPITLPATVCQESEGRSMSIVCVAFYDMRAPANHPALSGLKLVGFT